jgi:hypothetical protein
VWLVNTSHLGVAELPVIGDQFALHDRAVKLLFRESVVEAAAKTVESFDAAKERHRSADCLSHRPKFIDSMNVVAMVMGSDHSIEAGDARAEKLLAKIRSAIDENALLAAFD